MTIDQRVKEANGRLKSNYCGVRIEQIAKKLYVRGIFPPKPGSDKFQPHQQRIPISSISAEGVKLAEKLAKKISIQLDANIFDWSDWVDLPSNPSNIGEWITEFEKYYIHSKGNGLSARDTWKTEYVQVLKHLPVSETLTAENIKEAIIKTLPNTRTRKRYCQTLKVFCDFVGVDFDFKPYRGNYSSSKRKPRTLPDDKTIEDWYFKINNPAWQWAYGILATYGLRGHEIFFLKLDGLKTGEFYIEVLQGKTGYRLVYPFHVSWIEKFNLATPQVPEINRDRSHSAIGNTVTQFYGRTGLPFKPYDLRHAWAVRTLNAGLDISLAAQQMGHSLKVHSEIYHTWISANVHREAFKKILARDMT